MAYEPLAVATEHGSFSVKEELKRKVRIAAGCYQSLFRLPKLLNPFFNFQLFFQYISHKVLRWTLAPLALPTLLITSTLLSFSGHKNTFPSMYFILLVLQLLFYMLAIVGFVTQNRPFRKRLIYAPFYFTAMNYAMFKGFFRFLKGKQTVLWEKAKRA